MHFLITMYPQNIFQSLSNYSDLPIFMILMFQFINNIKEHVKVTDYKQIVDKWCWWLENTKENTKNINKGKGRLVKQKKDEVIDITKLKINELHLSIVDSKYNETYNLYTKLPRKSKKNFQIKMAHINNCNKEYQKVLIFLKESQAHLSTSEVYDLITCSCIMIRVS